MEIVFISNYFNHHQKPLADELYSLTKGHYRFIATQDVPEFRLKFGYQEFNAPYVLKYNESTKTEIDNLISDADVVVYGEAPISIIKARYNAGKLTFRDDESRYKNINRYLKWPVYSYNSIWINKGYLLCASAFAPIDYVLSGINPMKCFKWGYFTELKTYEIDLLMRRKRDSFPQRVSILWTGRLIGLKHPETTIRVAEHLKKKGLSFIINIIGDGPLGKKLRDCVIRKRLDDVIHFLGSMSPEMVRHYMEQTDIFMFTSDRQEGWGAVLNESMNSGCAVVADGNIGSVPYLIDNGINGIIYKSTDWKDLCEKVEHLARDPRLIEKMGRNAYRTIASIWNPQNAASSFIELCESLIKGENTHIQNGPCSISPVVFRKWKGIINTL